MKGNCLQCLQKKAKTVLESWKMVNNEKEEVQNKASSQAD